MTGRFFALLAAVALVATVAGCGGKPPDHGTVTGKEDIAEHYTTELRAIYAGESCYYSSSSKSESCSPRWNWVPYQQFHAEQFVLDLNVCDPQGKCKNRKVTVGQTEWLSMRVGDYWTKDGQQ